MKKFGQFMFSFLPFILVIIIQYAATFFSMGISALIAFLWSFASNTGFSQTYNQLLNLWMANSFKTGIMIIYSTITLVLFGIWYYCRYGGDYLPNMRKIFHPLSLLGIVMLVPGLQYLSTYIVNLTATLFPHSLEVYEELLESAGLDERITIGMFIYSVLLAPVCEELVFRGVTMHQAKKCLPFWLANLFQAVLFGFFHMNLIQGVYAFFLGLFLGYICQKSGSIYTSILLHLLFNFWGTVLSQFFFIGNSAFSFIFFFFFSIAMTAGGIYAFNAGNRRRI